MASSSRPPLVCEAKSCTALANFVQTGADLAMHSYVAERRSEEGQGVRQALNVPPEPPSLTSVIFRTASGAAPVMGKEKRNLSSPSCREKSARVRRTSSRYAARVSLTRRSISAHPSCCAQLNSWDRRAKARGGLKIRHADFGATAILRTVISWAAWRRAAALTRKSDEITTFKRAAIRRTE